MDSPFRATIHLPHIFGPIWRCNPGDNTNNKQKVFESKLNMLMGYHIEDYVSGPIKRYVNILSQEVNLRIGPLASIIQIPVNNDLLRLYFNLVGPPEVEVKPYPCYV
ncbi:hypothetical protein Hanom_Chr07g00639751 [Helianthus anomalus]